MKEIQRFTGYDLFTFVLLLSAVVAVVGSILFNQSMDRDRLRARHKAEGMAHQLLDGGVKFIQVRRTKNRLERTQRGPASSGHQPSHIANNPFGIQGEIGKDPWGNPYRYRFVENEQGQLVSVVVWSDGPNRSSDTDPHRLIQRLAKDALKSPQTLFEQDDIGHSVYVDPKKRL